MSLTLCKVVEHLYSGTIPDDEYIQDVCGKVVIIYISLAFHSDEVGEPITMHLVENAGAKGDSKQTSVVVTHINSVWTLKMIKEIAKVRKDVINNSTFNQVGVFPLTDTIEVYAAYKSLLRHPCSVCNEEYRSDINRVRCENSHVHKKKPRERSNLPIEMIEAYWDGIESAQRKDIVKHAETYFSGIPSDSVFPDRVMKFLEVVSGNVDGMSGRDLMIALDLASEYTFSWRITRPLHVLTLFTRGDFVAAMAHSVINRLAEAYSQDAAEKLLGEIQPKKVKKKCCRKVQKKRSVKPPTSAVELVNPPVEPTAPPTPPMVKIMFDEEKIIENIERQLLLEEQYAQGAYGGYIDRLEKSIFSVPAIRDLGLWADME